MKKRVRRFVTALLTFSLLFGMVPAAAFAEEETLYEEIECRACEGTGTVDHCLHCDNGVTECPFCDLGDIEIDCSTCDGMGFIIPDEEDGDGEFSICGTCDGAGYSYIECPECDGTGYVDCTQCGGQYSIEPTACEVCAGTGKEQIPHTEHYGGEASCSQKAVCSFCQQEYGELLLHSYVNSYCEVCGAEQPEFTGAAALFTDYRSLVDVSANAMEQTESGSDYQLQTTNHDGDSSAELTIISLVDNLHLSFEYYVSTEEGFDEFKIHLNGENTVTESGEETGSYSVILMKHDVLKIGYYKDYDYDELEDTVWLGSFNIHLSTYEHGTCTSCGISHTDHTDDVESGICDVCGIEKQIVSLTSKLVYTDDCDIANLEGGGIYWPGEQVTVRAEAKAGCSFQGWYKDDEKVCDDLIYTFFAGEEEIGLTAQYYSNEKVTVTVSTMNGGSFKVDGAQQVLTSYTAELAIGQKLVLKAADSDKVKAWVNGCGRTLGTGRSITITVTSASDITLIYKAEEANQAMVEFVSDYGQLLSCKNYSATDTIEFPAGPSKTGYNFVGWSLSEEEIKQKITAGETSISIIPVYEQKDIEYQVVVLYPEEDTETFNVSEGESIEFIAYDMYSDSFSYWKDEDGNVLSYSKYLHLYVTRDITVEAVYEGDVERMPVVTMDTPKAFEDGGNKKIAFNVSYDVLGDLTGDEDGSLPEGYNLVEVGVVRSTVADTETSLVIGGENTKQMVSKLKANAGCYTANINVGTNVDTVIYVRGYVIVRNLATQNLETRYTGIVSGSYNSLNN